MKTFTYAGPVDHNVTIRTQADLQDIRLSKGQTVDLPEDHPHIISLISSGLLVEVTNKSN